MLAPNRFRNDSPNLGDVEMLDGPSFGGLGLPAHFAVHLLHKHATVFVRRHGYGRVADPTIRLSAIHIRSRRSSTHFNRQHFAVAIHANPLNDGQFLRFDSPKFFAQVLDSAFAYLLALYFAFRGHAKQHMPPTVVEHGAHGFGCLAARPRRMLELEGLGFAGGDQGCDLVNGHGYTEFRAT